MAKSNGLIKEESVSSSVIVQRPGHCISKNDLMKQLRTAGFPGSSLCCEGWLLLMQWIATQKEYERTDREDSVYYMSMEFLMGRALGNNTDQHYVP